MILERLHLTLKLRIEQFQRWHNTEHYINNLQGIIKGYNRSYDCSIKIRPVDMTRETEDRVFFDSFVQKQPKVPKR